MAVVAVVVGMVGVVGAALAGCAQDTAEETTPSRSSEVQVDDEGGGSAGTEEGSVRVSSEGELPTDFPAEIPMPSAPHDVVSATETEVVGDQDASSTFVVLDVAAAPDAVAAELADAFGAAGFVLESDQEVAGATSWVHRSPTLLVTLVIGPGDVDVEVDREGGGDGASAPSTALTYTVIPAGPG